MCQPQPNLEAPRDGIGDCDTGGSSRRLTVMRIGFVCGLLAIALSLPAQNSHPRQIASDAGSFDAPLDKKIVDFGPSPYHPRAQTPPRIKLSCFYFPAFMIKEYDEGEKGAEWLAIVPTSTRDSEKCSQSHASSERVIAWKEWCGYFKGVKRNFAFFDACDGDSGGLPFVVYDMKTGKNVYQDSAYDSNMWRRKATSPFDRLRVVASPQDEISLKYLRVVETECDLRTETSCWERIRRKMNLTSAQAPTCTGYSGIKGRLASALAYPVEVALSSDSSVRTISGSLKCWPVD